MAAKGVEAKASFVKRLQSLLGEDFIGEYDKKIYVWSKENGDKIQLALNITCPKTPVGEINPVNLSFGEGLDFENMGDPIIAPASFVPAEVTEEEQQNIADLLRKLNL